MIAQDFLVHMREASPSRSPAEGSVRVLASLTRIAVAYFLVRSKPMHARKRGRAPYGRFDRPVEVCAATALRSARPRCTRQNLQKATRYLIETQCRLKQWLNKRLW